MAKIIRPQQPNVINFKELWEYRELFFFLSLKDIKLRYKHPLIAIFWAIIPSFALTLILTISFGEVLTPSLHIPYVLFAFSGLMFWNYFFSAVNRVSTSLLMSRSFITRIYFPKIIIPLSAIVVCLFDFVFVLLSFVLMLFYFQVPFSLFGIFFLLFGALLTTLSALGMGMIFSILNIFYKDIRELLPLITSFLFFLTPVIYPMRTVLKPYNHWLYLNPLTGIIETVRGSFFTTLASPWEGFIVATIMSIFLFLTGVFYFVRHESEITDIL